MTTSRGRREWTVMVYMAGQNRLFDEMVYGLKEMKRAANEDNKPVALLAEFSTKWVFRQDVSPTNPATPRRFDLKTSPHYPEGSVASNFVPVKQTKPHKTLKQDLAHFIAWGVKNYPASHYMVVFSGDGGGVNSDFLPSLVKPGRKVRAYELTEVFRIVDRILRRHIQFDIVGFDSCMMSMTEIGHGLRGHANLIVASQGNEDDLGWPFADILKPLTRKPTMSPRDLAINIVDKYNSYYLDYALIANSSASLSAIRLGRMGDLADAVRRFVNVTLPLLQRDQTDPVKQLLVAMLTHAHWVAQTFRQDQFTDLYDFCDQFVRDYDLLSPSHADLLRELRPIVRVCNRIKEVLWVEGSNESAIIKSCTVGAKYQHARGLSLYFPWNKINEHYHPGDLFETPPIKPDWFGRKTGWSKFLDHYIESSQRAPRWWPDLDQSTPFGRNADLLRRDPPEGRTSVDMEPEAAKNPPTTWKLSPCVVEPILPPNQRKGRRRSG